MFRFISVVRARMCVSFLVYSISYFVLCEEVDRDREEGLNRKRRRGKRLKFNPKIP